MARRPDNPRPGLLVIDKPAGITSHDVVARVRRLGHTRKVGHGGTLDPMATGVLVIGVGKATKLLTWVSGHSKEYLATIRFGIGTNTDDAEGLPTSAVGCTSLSESDLEAALAPLRGDIMQVPTTVSAIKVNGKRAYALARAGQDVELAARPVRISRLEVLAAPRVSEVCLDEAVVRESACVPGPVRVVDVDVAVECSSGTYVRALARDAGAALGVGAHLTALRRTRVGDFPLEGALTLDELADSFTDADITAHVYTKDQPDPDLVIRTSGEQRLSGFMLWQSVHSEYYFCEVYWPDFRRVDFLRALRSYAQRERRMGK